VNYLFIGPNQELILNESRGACVHATGLFIFDYLNRQLFFKDQLDTVSYNSEFSEDELRREFISRAIQILESNDWRLKKLTDL